jgi:hypothetical protein
MPNNNGNNTITSSSSSPFPCTILWSTQGGRAKACARRTARLIRDQQLRVSAHANATYELPSGYYGSSFDDYGPLEFFKLGHDEPSCYPTTTSSTSISSSTNAQQQKRLVIMFVSTTGDAEHCDSIKDTWKQLLQKN